jgi:hypothetical protein
VFPKQSAITCALLLVLLGSCGVSVHLSSGAVRIAEVAPCRELTSDGQCAEVVSVFPAGTDHVYVFFRLEGPVTALLQFKWFREGSLIGTLEQRVEPGLRYAWLATKEGESFAPGRYKTQIIMEGTVLGETYFLVSSK